MAVVLHAMPRCAIAALLSIALLAACSERTRRSPDAARVARPRVFAAAPDARGPDGRDDPAPATDGGVAPTEALGFWVWRAIIDRGRVVREIADDDMAPRVGPGGWPGCPENTVCTRHGINQLALGPRGQFWLVVNPNTSSDFQRIGAVTTEGDLATVHQWRFYSCAHPGLNDARPATQHFRYRVVRGELWVSTVGRDGLALSNTPPAVSDLWVVFRRVTEREFFRGYLLRQCQDDDRAPRCFVGCWSLEYGR